MEDYISREAAAMGLIDKKDFLEKMKQTDRYFAVRFDIEEMPEVDPIHYAGGCYCRECEYGLMDLSGREAHLCMKDVIRKRVKPNSFCSYGRRREGAE